MGIKHVLPVWKQAADTITFGQDGTINAFSTELEELESNMDNKVSETYSYWLPLLKEATPRGNLEMKAFIEKTRKTDVINAGKQASISLFSKAARNNFLLRKVCEFVQCISFTTSIFHQVQLLETEVDVAKQQRDIHKQFSADISQLEKDLFAEFNAIRIETKEQLIYSRAEKAKQYLNDIYKSNRFGF